MSLSQHVVVVIKQSINLSESDIVLLDCCSGSLGHLGRGRCARVETRQAKREIIWDQLGSL